MWLPVPTPKMVEDFQEVVRREHGFELDQHEALDAATRLIQIAYLLKAYGLPPRSKGFTGKRELRLKLPEDEGAPLTDSRPPGGL